MMAVKPIPPLTSVKHRGDVTLDIYSLYCTYRWYARWPAEVPAEYSQDRPATAIVSEQLDKPEFAKEN